MSRLVHWNKKHKMRRGYFLNIPVMYCRECQGIGKTLTKNCVGRMMTDAEEREVEAGRLDFINGQWEKK